MKLSMNVPRLAGPEETATWASAMETAGLDVIWIGEAYGFDANRDEAAALVPADYLRATSLVGQEGFVRERIEAYRAAGVTCLNIELPDGHEDRVGVVEKLRVWADG